ncbi:ABC transporter ATP-binding protein [Aquabacter sp. L1I39]|uniref:ABC transporter ATP-binding protein n=1 Tax=Aquabacter sp. L1I39 TaxID=2820278 RepID=UPI001ADA042F|nr:ABC transporter ATP-binding protein [Aquabacter sp. L1I39]QTL04759.1 ABC transporter ATP-binding protein [Aquabacter sp. L1I39]
MSTTAPSVLELRGVTRKFGGLVAVNDLSMTVAAGSIHGLIGPNGAGKSTAFDLISGLTRISAGHVLFSGADVTATSPEYRVRLGLARTFQTPRLFEQMSVIETVMTGTHIHGRMGFLGSLFAVGAKAREEAQTRASAQDLLTRVGLGDDGGKLVTELSYGRRRLVEIARALATRPRILLLDEVTSGLNPSETDAIGALIRALAAEGMTVVLVEHDMRFVMALCQTITVLNFGSQIANGPPQAVSRNADVITAYLGQPKSGGLTRGEMRRAAAAERKAHP